LKWKEKEIVMPHYYFAVHTNTGNPGKVFLGGPNDSNNQEDVDTASSEDAVLHEHEELLVHEGHEEDNHLLMRQSQQGPKPTRLARTRKPRGLGRCKEIGLQRELSSLSGTCAAVVTAAELSLRTLSKLEDEEFLSVSALEEFTALLGSGKGLSTLYHTLTMAKQTGFLKERDVDPLTNRYAGTPSRWLKDRFTFDFVLLNTIVETEVSPEKVERKLQLSPEKIVTWLSTEGPVIARVDPRHLLLPDPIKKVDVGKTGEAHHAVVIIGADAGDKEFVVRTGWRRNPIGRVKYEGPTEAWGLVWQAPPHERVHGRNQSESHASSPAE
jgi:hypothetical protein